MLQQHPIRKRNVEALGPSSKASWLKKGLFILQNPIKIISNRRNRTTNIMNKLMLRTKLRCRKKHEIDS